MTTNIATVVDFERVASDKVWAELDTANKRIAALEYVLIESLEVLSYAARGADLVTFDKLAVTIERVKAAL